MLVEVFAVVLRHAVVGGQQILQYFDDLRGAPGLIVGQVSVPGGNGAAAGLAHMNFSAQSDLTTNYAVAVARASGICSSTRRRRSSSPATTRVRYPPHTQHNRRFGGVCDSAPQVRQLIVTTVVVIDNEACA